MLPLVCVTHTAAMAGDKAQAEKRIGEIVALHVATLAALTNLPTEGGNFAEGKKRVSEWNNYSLIQAEII